jgi:hypothetical protein
MQMLEYNKKEIYIQFRTSVPQTSDLFRLQSHILSFVTGQKYGKLFSWQILLSDKP